MQPTTPNSSDERSSLRKPGHGQAADSDAVSLAEATLNGDLKADFEADIEAMFNAEDP
jgi:hypothetical protein